MRIAMLEAELAQARNLGDRSPADPPLRNLS
jgi:hypothetical protein